MTHRLVAILIFLSLLGATLACDPSRMSDMRRAQYPPDFHYITKQEIHSTMGQLATEVVALDGLLSKQGGPTGDDRQKILEILGRMRTLAGQLKKGSHSSHPRIDRYAPQLRAEIDRAREEVQMSDPPSYYQVGQVVGACTYCHLPRHEDR
jgi:hypothetical protein